MAFKDYEYEQVDGIHFPDANKGDDVYYVIPFTDNEADTLMEHSFILPEEVTVSDSYVNDMDIFVKLLSPLVGNFKITCIATVAVGPRREVDHIVRILKVY